MLTLEILRVLPIELEEIDGSLVLHDEEMWVKVAEVKSKKAAQDLIEERRLWDENLRLIHPGGKVSDPKSAKVSKNGNKPKVEKERLMHKQFDTNNPPIVPEKPEGRMRLIKRAIEEENTIKEDEWTEEYLDRLEEEIDSRHEEEEGD